MRITTLEERLGSQATIIRHEGDRADYVFLADRDHGEQVPLFAVALPLLAPDGALYCEGDRGTLAYAGGDVVLSSADRPRILYSPDAGKATHAWAPLDAHLAQFTQRLSQGCTIGFNDDAELLAQHRDAIEMLRAQTLRAAYGKTNQREELLARSRELTRARSDVMIRDLLASRAAGTRYQVVGAAHLDDHWYAQFTRAGAQFATVELTRPYARAPGAHPDQG